MICTHCLTLILPGHEERCWWCTAPLCVDCWEVLGHCGHQEAEALNASIRAWPRGPQENCACPSMRPTPAAG